MIREESPFRNRDARSEEVLGESLGLLLGMLRRQRNELDRVICHLESLAPAAGSEDFGLVVDPILGLPVLQKVVQEGHVPVEVSPDEFVGLTAWAACYRFLSMAGKPQGMQAIKSGLTRGGFGSRAKTIESTLHTAMNLKRDLFNRPAAGLWGLVEWNKINNLHKTLANIQCP